MSPNRRKSGIMHLNWKSKRQEPTETELFGYPIVHEYKYLGGWLNDRLKVAGHLNHVERKISFLTHKLTPVRMLHNFRLNVNLFRLMCMPLYRMGMENAIGSNKTDQNEYFKAIRRRFKQFCYLPKCTPNGLIKMLLGDVEEVALGIVFRAADNIE